MILPREYFDQNGLWQRVLLLVAAIFLLVNGLILALVEGNDRIVLYAVIWGGWLGLSLASVTVIDRFRPCHDPFFLPITLFLLGWGLLLVERLAPNFILRQLIWVVISIMVIVGTAILPSSLRILRRYHYTWLIVGLALLAGTLIWGVNPSGFGARLWLKVPFLPIYFQPSELLKLLLIVFLAGYFSQREELLRFHIARGWLGPLPYLLPLLFMWGFCMALLVWQQDLGAATLFFIVFLALLYIATGEYLYLGSGGIMLLCAGAFAYWAFDLVALRIEAWVNPWPDANDRAFQIVQSLYAIASGGVFGQGIGQGFPDYIPVVHSDFAFAAIAEEWGLIGSITVVACFAVLAYRGFHVALLARRPFHMYMAAGITILFSAQAILIMGGVTKLLPLTGVTLPFVSYGGSSLLISSIMMGMLIYVSNRVHTL